MKHFVKHLDGFSVVYLHNPFDCSKCVKLIKSDEENFKKTFRAFHPEKKSTQQPNYEHTSVPLSNLPVMTQMLSKGSNLLEPLQLSSTPLSSCKTSNKKKISPSYSKCNKQFPSNFGKINKQKSVPKHSKKTSSVKLKTVKRQATVKLKTVKKQASKSVQKCSGDKIPGKGTLKRKRWCMELLQEANKNYQDDLFMDVSIEGPMFKSFENFFGVFQTDSDNSETRSGMETAVYPKRISSHETPIPEFDCYSLGQLSSLRKRREKYQYHLDRKRNLDLPQPKKEEEETSQVVEKEKADTLVKKVEEAQDIIRLHLSKQEETSDNEDDQYFSDLD